MPFLRQFFSHRLIWLSLLVSVGIGALFARTIWTIRNDEWNYAVQTGANLARSLDHSLAGAIDSFDKSLEGAAREVSRPEVWNLPPALRSQVIFDNSLRVRGAGDVLVLDAQGQVLLDSRTLQPRDMNLADRDYFSAFKEQHHEGLFIGKPVVSRVSGLAILPLARGYYGDDGALEGVVVGVIRLNYLNELFGSLDLGDESGVSLFRTDGTIVSRFPYGRDDVGKSVAGTANFALFRAREHGSFVGVAALDNIERLNSFRRVGTYPLVVNVALSSDNILHRWYRSAWVLGSFAALLMAACVGLAMLFVRELLLRQNVSARLLAAEHDVRTILDNMPSMIAYWDTQLRNRFANQAHVDWYGKTPAQLRGTHIRDMVGAERFAMLEPFLKRALQGEPQVYEGALTSSSGVSRHLMVSYVPDIEHGQTCGIFVQATDITDRKRMEDELFDEKERARLTLQSIGDAVVCTDAHGCVTYINPAAERLTGWQGFDAAGQDVDTVLGLRDPSHDALRASAVRTAIGQQRAVEAVRGVVVHRSGGPRFDVEETASPITDRHGVMTGAVTVLHDMTEAVAMAERMAHLAQYDALTDLPNRLLLHDRAHQAMAQARRDGTSLAVMYLDLDGFKGINDRLGHEAGDQLLVQFAQRLKAAVRASDTVCRQGGDEFVVLLPGLDGPEPACGVARKILGACDAAFELAGEAVHIGLSGGIALYPQHGDTLDALSRHADTAMYQAKRGGRMRFMLYRGPQAAPEVVAPHA